MEEGGWGVGGQWQDQHRGKRVMSGDADDRGGGDHLHVDIVCDDWPGRRPMCATQAAVVNIPIYSPFLLYYL